MTNPFSNHGQIVSNNRFIGRQKIIRKLQARVWLVERPGSVFIVGMPRIGKTSLIIRSYETSKQHPEFKPKVFIQLDTHSVDINKGYDLFVILINRIIDEIEQNYDIEVSTIKDYWNKISQSSDAVTMPQLLLVFASLKTICDELNRSIVCHIEYFDRVRDLFRNTAYFTLLRELTTQEKYKIAFIIESSRDPINIARQAGNSSDYWTNTFTRHYVVQYDIDELKDYKKQLSEHKISAQNINMIVDLYGGHPYILDMFANELVLSSGTVNNKPSIISAWSAIRADVKSEIFKRLITTVNDSDLLVPLLNVIDEIPITTEEREQLEDFGLISSETKKCFSPVFESYLRTVNKSVLLQDHIGATWQLWTTTETKLRNHVTNKLVQKYTLDWQEAILNDLQISNNERNYLMKNFQKMETYLKSDNTTWGSQLNVQVLEYASIQNLKSIMFTDWSYYSNGLFTGPERIWGDKLSTIHDFRNSLAHNRQKGIPQERWDDAVRICTEICTILP
jgi:hypothetical protein